MHPVILKEVNKTYHLDSVGVPALCDINLEIRSNRFTVISGPSGSGKTTLLNVIGCIDRPDRGEVLVAGQDVQKMSDNALSDFRAHQLGFIFQNFNLLQVFGRAPPGPALRRAAPAGGHCPCAGHRTQAGAGRRAHRQSGQPNWR